MRIKISVPITDTESKSKVEKACKNLFPSMIFILSGGYFVATSEDVNSLDHFKDLLKTQKIRDAAHRILKRSLSEGNLEFYLNKQAAYAGKVNFSETCPLGPITVSIRGKKLVALIEELSPRTAER